MVKHEALQANAAMRKLLAEQKIVIDEIPEKADFPIWMKRDAAGRPYWGAGHFWNMDKGGVDAERDLSQLEWDGNEVHLDAYSEAEIPRMLRDMIGILKSWQRQMERDWPDTPFCLLGSYDDGAELVNNDDSTERFFTVTFRFWAPRGRNSVVYLGAFDEWRQPALLGFCGGADRECWS